RLILFFLLLISRPPCSLLFPYTTLFRSCRPRCRYADLRLRARGGHRPTRGRPCRTGPAGCRTGSADRAGRPDRPPSRARPCPERSEEHTSELQSRGHLVCRLLLEKKKTK